MQAAEAPWQPDAAATSCFLCASPYHLFFRRHHCRRCGRVVCGPCSTARSLLSLGPIPLRVCDACKPSPGARKPRFSAAEEDEDDAAVGTAATAPPDPRFLDALTRFYAEHRVDYAHAGKVAELWRKFGPAIWARLAEKYGAQAVAAALHAAGAPLPQAGTGQPALAAVDTALAALCARDEELRAMQVAAEAAAEIIR